MKNFKYIAVLSLTVLLGSIIGIFAQTGNTDAKRGERHENGRRMPHGGFNPWVMEQLNLTDAQKTQINELLEKSRTDSETFFAKIQQTREALKGISKAANFNETQAREILAAKAQTEIELELIRLRTDAAIYNSLTAEQKSKFDSLEQSRPDFGPGGKRGGRPGFRPEQPRPQN